MAESGLAQCIGPVEVNELPDYLLAVLSQKAPQGLFLGGQRGIVVMDQMEDALCNASSKPRRVRMPSASSVLRLAWS